MWPFQLSCFESYNPGVPRLQMCFTTAGWAVSALCHRKHVQEGQFPLFFHHIINKTLYVTLSSRRETQGIIPWCLRMRWRKSSWKPLPNIQSVWKQLVWIYQGEITPAQLHNIEMTVWVNEGTAVDSWVCFGLFPSGANSILRLKARRWHKRTSSASLHVTQNGKEWLMLVLPFRRASTG